MKPKKCKGCGSPFTPARPLQVACGPLCGLDLARAKREKVQAQAKKEERKADVAKLAKLSPIRNFEKKAEKVVNAYVRLRDRNLGCCSCDKGPNWDGQWHASHLRSVGAASSVRYNLWNIAKGCSQCNNHLSGNLAVYLPRARERWGDERIDWLYAQNKPVKYSREYLERLRAVFAKKLRRLERRIKNS